MLYSLVARFALGCLLLAPSGASGSITDDMALIKSRIIAHQTSFSVSSTTVEDLRSALAADGTWPGITYTGSALPHLSNLLTLARAYAKPGSPYKDNVPLLDEILLAYDAWITRDPIATNWWYNEIHNPQRLGEIMLLVESELSTSRKTSGLSRVARAYIPRSTNSGTNTGVNRTDRAYASLMRGLLAPDAALVSESILAIGDTILVTTAEGVQPDQSYHQHGAQLYMHGYGQSYLTAVARYGQWVAGTSFAYDPLQVRVLVDFLLDGVQWYIRGDSMDFTSYGRNVTRAPQLTSASSFTGAATSVLMLSAGYRAAELQAFSTRLKADVAASSASADRALMGTRHFWRSDSTTHHRPNLSVFIKTSSTRTLQPETGNGEGLKNLHLADGVTFLMRDGNEYDGIMPVWDWRNLPGTTTEQGTYSLKPASDWGLAGTSTHVGAATSGNDAAVAYSHQRLSLNARKSWFLFDDRLIALGSGIQRTNGTAAVLTCVNDCLLRGSVKYSSDGLDLLDMPGGSSLPASALRWVHHDGIGYYFPTTGTPASVRLSSASRSGSWQELNTGQSSTTVTREVFSLRIDHGIAPASGGYAYIAAPVDASSEMVDHPAFDVEILRQDATAHAVRDAARGLTGANFWQAGEAAGITASAAACVLVSQDAYRLDVSLADPTQASSGELVLDIAVPVAGTLHADSNLTIETIAGGVRLRATRAALQGRTVHAAFFIRPDAYEILEIPAEADAFVHDAQPDQAYGTGDFLATKLISGAAYNRTAYLRFAIPPLPAPPVAASLRLHAIYANGPGIHSLLPIEPSAWTESSLTWNNRPQPRAAPLGLWLPAANTAASVDVTGELPADCTVGGLAEFSVAAQTRMSDGLTHYASREHSDPAMRPMLRLAVPRIDEAGLIITTTSLPIARVGTAYGPFVFTVINAFPPLNWQIVDGNLPDGMEFLSDGTLQGTPTELGAFPLVIRVADAVNQAPVDGTVTLEVRNPAPTITAWPVASGIVFGQDLSDSTLSGGSASVEGSFAFDSPATTPNAGSYDAAVTFTPTDTNSYDSVGGGVTVEVDKATPVDTAWPTASAIQYGDFFSASILSGGSASVPGSFAFSDPAGLFDGQDSFTFRVSDDESTSAPATVSITVDGPQGAPESAPFEPNASRPWTPADLTTLAWYDAADVSTVTVEHGAVSQWSDKSGNARHVAQSTSGRRPTVSGSTIEFDGTDDFLTRSGAFCYAAGSADFYVVAAATNGNARIIAENRSSADNPMYGFRIGSDVRMGAYVRADDGSELFNNTMSAISVFSRQTPNLYLWRDTGSNLSGRVAGGSSTKVGYSRSGKTMTLDQFSIGATGPRPNAPNGLTFVNAGMNEIVITANLSDEDRQKMEGYLAWKWKLQANLPGDHPYKQAAPVIITSSPPVAIAQSVTVQPGTPTAITLSGSDPDDDPLTFEIVTPPAYGALTGTAPNLTYAPPTLPAVGTHDVAVVFTPADSANYHSVTGTVNVIVNGGSSPYAAWAAQYPDHDLSDPYADTDGDGLSNFHEFAFGLNPTNGSSNHPIVAPFDKASRSFSYTRRADSGLTYTVCISTDLGAWEDLPLAQVTESVADGAEAGVDIVNVTISSLPDSDNLFLRVKAD